MKTENALLRRLKALTTFRAFFVTVLLGSFFVFEIGLRIFPYPQSVLHLIVLLYILTIAYALLLSAGVGTRLFAYVQLCLDLLSAVSLIFLTGGIESWFSFLLLLIVIAGAIVLGKRAGYLTATLGGVLYGSLIDLQYYGLLPIPYETMLREKDFLYNIFSHIAGLYLTAYLIGHLTSGLEKATTSLEKKETVLRDLALFNKEVIEGMPSGLFTTDTEGSLLLWNRSAEEITGLKREAVMGNDIRTVLPFMGDLGAKERTEGVLESANKVIGLTVSPMKDASGAYTGWIGIFEDLSELKRMQEEMKHKERLADIGELAANMAHEIRNPLASLKGSIEMLGENSVSSAHKERLMEIALGEMDRLNSIITDFLAYSRPRPLEFQRFDLNQMLDEMLQMLRSRNPEGVVFTKNGRDPLVIKGDPQRLQQVFWNLCINAIEAMPGGGRLDISASGANGRVEIAFRDTGAGISPENLKRVFYPFFTTKEKGTGLGLSIAYGIVEAHKGRLAVWSKKGEGAVFKVFLPGE